MYFYFFLVIFSCKVGENVCENEAIHRGASFKSLKYNIRSLEDVLRDKVSVFHSVKIKVIAGKVL